MMKLDVDWIELTDFKAYQGTHYFDLTKYEDGALHFMRGRNNKRMGSNGAGKSTLLCDAMTWCFYGQTAAGLKNPDVKPWHFKGKTQVRVGLHKGKDQHVIARTISPNGQTIDDKEAGPDDIERLLGMRLELFINTIALAQGRPLWFDLDPKGKMKLFVDALDLERWDGRATAATARVNLLTASIAKLDGEADGLRATTKTIERLIEEEGERARVWDDEYAERVANAKKEIAKYKKEQDEAQDKRDDADRALDTAETELRHYSREFEKSATVLGHAEAAIKADAENLLAGKGRMIAMRAKLRSLGEGDTCETCGQSLKGTALAKHRKKLKDEIEDFDETLYPDETLVDAFDKANEAHKKTREHLLKYQRQSNEARDLLDTYDRRVSTLKGIVEGLEQVITRREAELNPHKAQLRNLKAELKTANANIADCLDERGTVENKLTRAKFWTKGFKDIRLFVLEEVMQELELATNAMLDEAGLVGWDIRYEVERETARGTTSRGLTILVRSPASEGHVKWESWSGGEAQRLRVVGALALSEVLLNHAGVEPSLEILDEPTQHLSPEGVRDLCEYLSDRAVRLGRQIWYVDQQAIESRYFASVTTIEHDKGGAHVVLQGNRG